MSLPKIEIVSGKGGVKYALYQNNDILAKEIRANGEFASLERGFAQGMADYFKAGDILDIGANLGAFSVPLAIQAPFCKIHAYEVQRLIFSQLCTNIFINRVENIFPVNCALGNSNKIISIPDLDLVTSTNVGGFTVDDEIRSNLKNSYIDKITAPNTFLSSCTYSQEKKLDSFTQLEKIIFIKLDVEGYELEVLQGAKKILKKNNYPPIIFEDWGDKFEWYKKKSEKLNEFLKYLGYDIQKISPRERLAQHKAFEARFVIANELNPKIQVQKN